MKAYEKSIDSRIWKEIEVDEIQVGFMTGKRKTDGTVALRQVQLTVIEGKRKLFIAVGSEEEFNEMVVQWQETLENKVLREQRKKTEMMVPSKLGRKVRIKNSENEGWKQGK